MTPACWPRSGCPTIRALARVPLRDPGHVHEMVVVGMAGPGWRAHSPRRHNRDMCRSISSVSGPKSKRGPFEGSSGFAEERGRRGPCHHRVRRSIRLCLGRSRRSSSAPGGARSTRPSTPGPSREHAAAASTKATASARITGRAVRWARKARWAARVRWAARTRVAARSSPAFTRAYRAAAEALGPHDLQGAPASTGLWTLCGGRSPAARIPNCDRLQMIP